MHRRTYAVLLRQRALAARKPGFGPNVARQSPSQNGTEASPWGTGKTLNRQTARVVEARSGEIEIECGEAPSHFG